MEAPDPRDRVTQTAFQITPELLGVELAHPWRRAAAFGIDLLLAGIVSGTGGGAAVGIVAAVLFVLIAMRTPSKSRPRRVGRAALVSIGALTLFGVATGLVDSAREEQAAAWQEDSDAALQETLGDVDRQLEEAGVELDMSIADAAALDNAADEDEPIPLAERVLDLRRYADALAAGDSLAADTLRVPAAQVAAGDELADLEARAQALRERARTLRDQRNELQEAVDNPSFVRYVLTVAADFGLTLGWIGLYFTLTLAWWGGYTPGKRLLGIRAVRLDGKRMGLWSAFERFGGYIAGLATGLLGFAQVFWDANRQGVQDKIAGTVVVRMQDRKTPARQA